jgi:PAS domain S-box-containing protein
MTILPESSVVRDEDLFYHQALISCIDDIVISTDRDFIIKTWNASAEKTFAISTEDAIGRSITEFFPYHIETILMPGNHWKGLLRVIKEDGQIFFLQSSITVVRDSVQRKLGYVGVCRDVTGNMMKQPLPDCTRTSTKNFSVQTGTDFLQKKIAGEKDVFEDKGFFEAFVEKSPLPAWVVDHMGIVHYLNSAYLNLFGLSKDVIGRNVYELYPKEIAEEYFISKIVVEAATFPSHASTYKIIKFPLLFKDKAMIAGCAVDISNHIAIEESLSLLNQNKNKMISVISHDVRGPLGMNVTFLDTIIKDYNELTREELVHHLELLKTGISKCFNLTEELLLWARSQLQTINYNPCGFEAHIEIEKNLEDMKLLAARKKIVIETAFCKAGNIYCDKDLFAFVIRNFVSNAIKFSKENSAIIISTAVLQGKLMISVKDHGVGVNNELVKKLMQKLNYRSSFGTNGEKGSGLGLIIAKDYIERNNGEMFIESEEGKGSVFSFTVDFVKC